MNRALLLGLVILSPAASRPQSPAAPSAAPPAGAVLIQHDPVTCIVAESFPRIETRFQAADQVARVRAYFRAQTGKRWYFVEMKPEADLFFGVLPKPKKTTKRILYYIEATDRAFTPERTSEHDPEVVVRAIQCHDRLMAGALPTATIKVQGEPGAPAIPEGFEAAGVESDSSGAVAALPRHLPSKKTLGIGAAAVLVGGTALALAGGGNGAPVAGPVTVSPDGQALAAATTMTFTGSGTDPDNDPLTYTWDFGDRTSGTGASTTHIYSREGTFTATLTVSDGKASARSSGATVAAKGVNGPWVITLSASLLRDSAFMLSQGGATLSGQRNVSGLTAPLSGQVAHPREISLSSSGTAAIPGGFADLRGLAFLRHLVRLAFGPLRPRDFGATREQPPSRGLPEGQRVLAQYYPPDEPAPEPTPKPKKRASPFENSALCPFSAKLSFDSAVNQATGTITPEGPCADFGPATITMRRQ